MAFFEDLTKSSLSTVLLGVGVAMVAPTVLPALASSLRPLAKSLVKGGVTLYDAAKEGMAEAGEQLGDLVAETRAEMADGGRAASRMRAESHQTETDTGARAHRRRARA